MTASRDSSIKRTRTASWKIYGSGWLGVDWNFTRIRRAGSNSAGSPKRTGDVEGEGKPETFDFLGLTHISGKNSLGRFAVRRKTIRKRIRAKLRHIKPELGKRMPIPCPKPVSGSNRSCKATSTTTRYQATPLAYPCSGTGCLCSGGIVFAAAARSAGSPGPECWTWPCAGYLHRKCSIPIPMPVLPLLIRDKNRMR
jgi:hypothetical protein